MTSDNMSIDELTDAFSPISAKGYGCTQTNDFRMMKERVLLLCQHYFAWYNYTIVAIRSFWFMTLENQTFWHVASLFGNDENYEMIANVDTFFELEELNLHYITLYNFAVGDLTLTVWLQTVWV
jgi:hypothetical protein